MARSPTSVVLNCGFFLVLEPVISKEPFTTDERRAVFALASLYSFRMLGLFMVLPLLAIYTADLPGATPQTVGLALGAYGLTQACLQLPLGWLSDRIGRRPVIVGGLLFFILGSGVAASADSINGVILGRFLQGCGAIAAALTALAADSTRESQRTKTMAFVGASVGLSFAFALVLGPLIAAFGGLQSVFLVTAGLGLCGLIIVIFVLPTPVTPSVVERGDWEAGHVFGGGLPTIYGSIFLLHSIMMASFLVVPKLLADGLGFTPGHHWMMYLGTVILSVPPALLIMRQGRTDRDPKASLLTAVVPLLAGSLLALNSGSLWVMGLGLTLFFAGVNSLEALLPSTVSKLAPGKLRGTAMGLYATCQFLGIFIGGALGGWVYTRGGLHGVSLLLLLSGALWAAVLLKTHFQTSSLVTSGD